VFLNGVKNLQFTKKEKNKGAIKKPDFRPMLQKGVKGNCRRRGGGNPGRLEFESKKKKGKGIRNKKKKGQEGTTRTSRRGRSDDWKADAGLPKKKDQHGHAADGAPSSRGGKTCALPPVACKKRDGIRRWKREEKKKKKKKRRPSKDNKPEIRKFHDRGGAKWGTGDPSPPKKKGREEKP